MNRIPVVIAGRVQSACESVRNLLDGQHDLALNLRVMGAADTDPLAGLAVMPAALILCLGPRWEDDMRAVTGGARAPLIVIGPPNDPAVMRRAMQAGARDYFSPPVHEAELLEAVRRIAHDSGALEPAPTGILTAVIDVKGGSGASTLSGNLAHILAAHFKRKTCLIDLDLQFGTLPLAFDLELTHSLLDALHTEGLDPVALEGFVAKHVSGLHVLGTTSEQLAAPWEIPPRSLQNLLSIATRVYEHTMVDVPHEINPLTRVALENANQVLLVMQQSLAHIRDAKRLLSILTADLGIAREHVLLVVNRHQEDLAIRLQDIREAVQPAGIASVPNMATVVNDFARVSQALDVGNPLYGLAPDAEITRELIQLAKRLISGSLREPAATKPRRMGLRGALAGAFRRE